MLFDALAPSSALQLTSFSDIDAFRPFESMEDSKSIPLSVVNFRVTRAIVSLPACRIVAMRSFARILDTAYRVPGGMVIVSLTDDIRASVKGLDLDARLFITLRGNEECHFVEPQANHHAVIFLSPDLKDRGWFDRADDLQTHAANRPALLHTRQLLLDILRTASAQPHLFTSGMAEHLQEGLLLALDDLFGIGSASDCAASVQRERADKLVQRVDDYLAAHPTVPIYTADLASEFGVSIRTLGGAVSKVRGMSLHQYIRLKRLWETRARLLRGGGTSVASCARAQGFHHMGEFAASYRAIFHEAPSDTLARGRQSDSAA